MRAQTVRGTAVEVWRLCSACAGDYEDPDRTAPRGVEEEESESDARRGKQQREGTPIDLPEKEQ